MVSINSFKLEKLKIKAFSDAERTAPVGEPFEAMFNPDSLKESYALEYGAGQGLNSSDQSAVYIRSKPSDLNIKLLLDGTNVHAMGIERLGGQPTVQKRVTEFLQLTFRMNGDIHEPNYLLVEWGDLSLSCRMASVDVTYTSFARDGTALRAELNVTLHSDVDVNKRLRQENKNSPDLSHTRLVRSGDTLPLLTQEIYGSSAHYLFVAAHNRLDDFRNLVPGQQLLFPPLPK